MPCPGNWLEHCGGTGLSSRYVRRQGGIGGNVLLTVYISSNSPLRADQAAISGMASPDVKDAVTGGTSSTITGDALITDPVIQPDAPQATDVVNPSVLVFAGNPSPTVSAAYTYSLTSSASLTTTVEQPSVTTATCVGVYCSTEYMLEPYSEAPSSGEVVLVLEECACSGGSAYFPKLYGQISDKETLIYRPVPCSDYVPRVGTIYQPQKCDECMGGAMFVQAPGSTEISSAPSIPSGATLPLIPSAPSLAGGTVQSARPTPVVAINMSVRIRVCFLELLASWFGVLIIRMME